MQTLPLLHCIIAITSAQIVPNIDDYFKEIFLDYANAHHRGNAIRHHHTLKVNVLLSSLRYCNEFYLSVSEVAPVRRWRC